MSLRVVLGRVHYRVRASPVPLTSPLAAALSSPLPSLSSLLLALLAFTLCLGRNAEAQTSVFETRLANKQIGLDTASLAKYLNELHPTRQQRERVELLIRQLGDPKFTIRERATAELMRLPWLDKESLATAKTSTDAEVRWRAKLIKPKRNLN